MRYRNLSRLQRTLIFSGVFVLTVFLLMHLIHMSTEKNNMYSFLVGKGSQRAAQMMREVGSAKKSDIDGKHMDTIMTRSDSKTIQHLVETANQGKKVSSKSGNEDRKQSAVKIPENFSSNLLDSKKSSDNSLPEATIAADVTAECLPREDPSKIETSFKFYIYELPAKFNADIQEKLSSDANSKECYNLRYCGMGEELFQYSYSSQGTQLSANSKKGGSLHYNEKTSSSNGYQSAKSKESNATYYKMSVRNSQQFALETIIHYKLLHSPYRTTDPEQADAFYIPAYTGLTCLTYYSSASGFISELFKYLKSEKSVYFNSGKPHFSTLSKIQREQASEHCTTLRHQESSNITWIAIEKESGPHWSKQAHIHGKLIIVAPYPSYIHFANTRRDKRLLEKSQGLKDLANTKFILDFVPPISERDVFLFMASGTRRSNSLRAMIIDQFPVQTDLSYEEYFSNKRNQSSPQLPSVQLDTIRSQHQIMLKTLECKKGHRYTTIPWMMRSVFCLNPPGDSPTRKSFYDSILSGCIPVIFKTRYNTTYPFQKRLAYDTFTITIDETLISKKTNAVIDILRAIPAEKIASLHENLRKVAKWFQYSVPDGTIQTDDDALTLIMEELQETFGFDI